ncbi:LacI family transcriptional regulator [Tetzosporium hominis]|uniref:LacI family transcriptional regulator n=1 Tax=Tetzosporium hominis TaxID=2020506 RepID=A0A264W4I9_9BACL|nr:LacI family DNA-binding transcriptional regulator [Tetzosporium hominis]OZS78461.1 LacI family transcriptional regulator [Tetzosporium hominis]
MKKITMMDVANEAGVSKSTVSQYINNRYEYMSLETKKKIELAIKELNYRPNTIARSLKQKTTFTIGVIVSNILHNFSTQVIRAIEDVCHEQDFHVIVCNADDMPEKEMKYIQMLRDKQVDGLIVFPTGGNLDLYKELESTEFPVVFLDRLLPEVTMPALLLDNKKAVQLAVDHLRERGYESVLLVTNAINQVYPRKVRVDAFVDYTKEIGMDGSQVHVLSRPLEEIQLELKSLLQQQKIDAIIAGNDLALFEIFHVIQNEQLMIPTDIALISIDDTTFSTFIKPELTAIAQPAFQMGTQAATTLLDLIHQKEVKNEVIYYEPQLIIRGTT